jgi:hypothetical protein
MNVILLLRILYLAVSAYSVLLVLVLWSVHLILLNTLFVMTCLIINIKRIKNS